MNLLKNPIASMIGLVISYCYFCCSNNREVKN